MIKLLDISKIVISKMSKEEVYENTIKWAKKYDKDLLELLNKDKEYDLNVFGIERGNTKKPRKDISKWSDVKENIIYMYERPKEYDFDKIDLENAKKIILEYLNIYEFTDDKELWFNKIKDVSQKLGYAREVKEYKKEPEKFKGHVGDVSTVIRIVLTGRKNTPDMYEIMQVLGNEEVILRLKSFVKRS